MSSRNDITGSDIADGSFVSDENINDQSIGFTHDTTGTCLAAFVQRDETRFRGCPIGPSSYLNLLTDLESWKQVMLTRDDP